MAETMQTRVDCGLSPKAFKPLPSSPCDGQSQYIFFVAAIPECAHRKYLVMQCSQRVMHA